MMKTKEIRNMTEEQINAKIADLKEELFNLKFQAALGNLEKPARMNEIKRNNCKRWFIERFLKI